AFGHANLGLTYLQAGRYPDAERELRRARGLDTADTEIAMMLAKLFSLTGRRDSARAALEDVRKRSPNNARVLFALAELEAASAAGGAGGAGGAAREPRQQVERSPGLAAAQPSAVQRVLSPG